MLFGMDNLTQFIVSTLNGLAAIEFMGVSFGCNRRKTREKTQTSKEKATEEDLEKERLPVTQVLWSNSGTKRGETEIFLSRNYLTVVALQSSMPEPTFQKNNY
jgi:hypothetical protein